MPTHGSLIKAGKVRDQTHRFPSQRKKKRDPLRRNRRNYEKWLREKRKKRRS